MGLWPVDFFEDLAAGVWAVGKDVEGEVHAGEIAIWALEPDVIAVVRKELFSGESLEDAHVAGAGNAGNAVADVSMAELSEAFHGAFGGDDAPSYVVEHVDDEGPHEFATAIRHGEAEGVVEGAIDEDGVVGEGERAVGNGGRGCVWDHLGEAIRELSEHLHPVRVDVVGLEGGTSDGNGNGSGFNGFHGFPASEEFEAPFGGGAAMLPPDGGLAGVEERASRGSAGVIKKFLGLAGGVNEVEPGSLKYEEAAVTDICEFAFDEDIEVGSGFNDRRSHDSKSPVRRSIAFLDGRSG